MCRNDLEHAIIIIDEKQKIKEERKNASKPSFKFELQGVDCEFIYIFDLNGMRVIEKTVIQYTQFEVN